MHTETLLLSYVGISSLNFFLYTDDNKMNCRHLTAGEVSCLFNDTMAITQRKSMLVSVFGTEVNPS